MGAAAVAAAAVAQAIKASGTIVRLDADNFQKILYKAEKPLVVAAPAGLFKTSFQYLTSYRGLAFYTKSEVPLNLPASAEVVAAKSIWMPG